MFTPPDQPENQANGASWMPGQEGYGDTGLSLSMGLDTTPSTAENGLYGGYTKARKGSQGLTWIPRNTGKKHGARSWWLRAVSAGVKWNGRPRSGKAQTSTVECRERSK